MQNIIVNLSNYGPVIIKKEIGEEILNSILEKKPRENPIEIDMSNIEAMTTLCAKLIFGHLYTSLGADLFNRNIRVVNKTKEIEMVINMGIQSAIEDSFDQ